MWTVKNETNERIVKDCIYVYLYLCVGTENKQVIARGEESGERTEIGVEDQEVQNSSCTINES